MLEYGKKKLRRHAAFVRGIVGKKKCSRGVFIAYEEKRVSSRWSRYRVSVAHGMADYPSWLAHFHWPPPPPPTRKRKAIEECTAKVLYKLDVSQIFSARRCASGYWFRDKVAISIGLILMKIFIGGGSETPFTHITLNKTFCYLNSS